MTKGGHGARLCDSCSQVGGQTSGLIGATVGAILILLVWGFIASRSDTP